MIPSFENRHSAGGRACPMGGGGGSSSSDTSTKTTTTNIDRRVVADGGSSVITADLGSQATINVLDGGAIKGASDVALKAIGASSTNFDNLLATADKLLSQQQATQQASIALTGQLSNSAMAAYANAASTSSGNKPLIAAGLVVVALVGISAFKKA